MLWGFLVFSQENKVSFKFVEQELSSVLKELEKADVYKFMFNYDDVKGQEGVGDIGARVEGFAVHLPNGRGDGDYKTEGCRRVCPKAYT